MADSTQKLIKIPNLPERKTIPLHNFTFSEKYFHKTCLSFNSSLTAGPRKMKVLWSFKMSGTTHPTTSITSQKPWVSSMLHLGGIIGLILFCRQRIGKKFSHYIQINMVLQSQNTRDFQCCKYRAHCVSKHTTQ